MTVEKCNRIHTLLISFMLVCCFLKDSNAQGHIYLKTVPISMEQEKMLLHRGNSWINTQAWYKTGLIAGVNFTSSSRIEHSYKNKRLYYIFYNDVENINSKYEFIIQRVKKTLKYYRTVYDKSPITKTSFLVEIMKTKNGSFKSGADQHYADYSLGKYYKREMLKELEIGIGKIKGIVSGTKWPYSPRKLYKRVQGYQANPDKFNRVDFSKSKRWSIKAVFDVKGRYSISSRALGINVRGKSSFR